MDYFLVCESMSATVLFARDNWLTPGGILLPDKASIFIAGFENEQFYYNKTVEIDLSRAVGMLHIVLA
jgi:protein arginine N-methyltransferase 1